jgi:hypothetical protein
MPDPEGGPARIDDTLAENLAEEYLESATRGEDAVEDALDAIVPEELGGPFIETSAAVEYALDADGANPVDAEQEPLPRPVAGLVQPAWEAGFEASAEAEAEGAPPAEGLTEGGGGEAASLGPESYVAGEGSPPEELASRSRRRRR